MSPLELTDATKALLSMINLSGFGTQVRNRKQARSASENSRIRDTQATDLFTDAVDAYIKKLKTNKVLKIILFFISMAILIGFVVSFICCIFFVIRTQTKSENILAVLIPAGVTIISSVISIILVIAKYLFPQDEDKQFTHLVEVLTRKD